MGHVQVLLALALLGAFALTSAQAQGCPDKFNLVGTRCLTVSTEVFTSANRPKPWEVYREKCTSLTNNKWTVDFLSNFDVDFLRLASMEIVNNYPELFMGYVYWVGGEYKHGRWQWLDGAPIDVKSYIWLINNPKTTSIERSHIALVAAGGRRHYAWEREPNSTSPAYICEAKPKI